MENNDYICPKCHGYLKVNKKIIFIAKKENGDSGIILLNPQLGNYKRIFHKTLRIKEGDHLTFICPICHSDLSAQEISNNLARVLMIDKNGNEYKVLFSEIIGENCTYKVFQDEVEAFGEDSSEYLNYFGKGPA